MAGVALQVSATASSRSARPQQDSRASDQAPAPFASLIDDNDTDTPPARPDASQQTDTAPRSDAPKRPDRPQQAVMEPMLTNGSLQLLLLV